MRKFKFRMESTLNHRIEQEKSCYKHFIRCQVHLQDALADKKRLEEEKENVWKISTTNLNEFTTKEFYIKKIEQNITNYDHVITTLQTELKQAEEKWNISRMELKAMEKLKENAFRDWIIETNKIEQIELDEWTVTRRKSA